MAKSFKKSNPLDNIDNQVSFETSVAAVEHESQQNSFEDSKKKSKGKVGRPKTKIEETKTINIAVPVSTLNKVHDIKACFGNNLTKYINKLIENDLENNYDEYKHFAESLKKFK